MTPIELDLEAKALARPGGNVIVPSEQLAAIIEGLREAREVIGKLPRTADGVAIVPGMMVVSTHFGAIQEPREVSEIRDGGWRLEGSSWYFDDREGRPCYSTREAALAARSASAEGGAT